MGEVQVGLWVPTPPLRARYSPTYGTSSLVPEQYPSAQHEYSTAVKNSALCVGACVSVCAANGSSPGLSHVVETIKGHGALELALQAKKRATHV